MLVDDFINNIAPNYDTYKDFKRNPLTNNGKGLAIEELELTKFQASWISRYVRKHGKVTRICFMLI